MPSSLVIVSSEGDEDDLIGKVAQQDVFNGKSILISPVAFAGNSVTFKLAYNHENATITSFRIA